MVIPKQTEEINKLINIIFKKRYAVALDIKAISMYENFIDSGNLINTINGEFDIELSYKNNIVLL